MIVQDFHIGPYDWRVRVYYAVSTYWADAIAADLERAGCRGRQLERAWRNLSRGDLNTGLTFSNSRRRETVMVIALTSSPAEFQNSLDHEKGHLCRHIAQAFDLDPYGEEAQYLSGAVGSGAVGQLMFPVARRFLCEHCRRKLYEEQ